MTKETANYIMQRMTKYLDNSQMIKLNDVLEEALRKSEKGIQEKSSQELLEMFLATKRLEGRSEKTLFLYRFNIEKMIEKDRTERGRAKQNLKMHNIAKIRVKNATKKWLNYGKNTAKTVSTGSLNGLSLKNLLTDC